MANRRHKGRAGVVPIARNASLWTSTGWRVLKWSIGIFAVMGFIASFAGLAGSGGITINGTLVPGWRGVWMVTAACAFAGLLFGAIWLLIFKALALASRK